MDAAGIAVDPDLLSHGEFDVDEGVERGRALLQMAASADGDHDRQRSAGPRCLPGGTRTARLHIPEDVSVVGFDDLPVARWVGPPLTTIRQPLVEMAVEAAEMVFASPPANGWPNPAWNSPPN